MLIGLEVEIDESVVAKRKYNRGHLVKEKWVFRGYCSASGEVFLQMVPDRSAATLLPLVEQHIAPGSKIVSDKWPSYRGILGLQVEPKFKHTSVDHSRHFVDPETGACTNRVEAMWASCKHKFKQMCGVHESMLPGYLDEFLWRQTNGKKSGKDTFLNILKHIAEWYPTP